MKKKSAHKLKNDRMKSLVDNKKFKKLRLHHKILFSLIGTFGLVLIWRALWVFSEVNPFLNHPVASLVAGLVLLVISGFIYKLG